MMRFSPASMVSAEKGSSLYSLMYSLYLEAVSPVWLGTYNVMQPHGIVFLEMLPSLVMRSSYPVGEASMLVITKSRMAVYFFQLAFQKLKRQLKGKVCGMMAALTLNAIGQCWV